LIPCTG